MLGSLRLLSLSIMLAMAVSVQAAKMVNKEEIMKMKKEAEQQHETKKEELLEELQEAQILKEWEIIVKNLDDEQLDNIEEILAKNHERNREFEMIMMELKAMGMDEQDISDLKQLAEVMHEFLIQVPNLKIKLEIANNNDLLDNIQVFQLLIDFCLHISPSVSSPSCIFWVFLTSWVLWDSLLFITFLTERARAMERLWTSLWTRSPYLKMRLTTTTLRNPMMIWKTLLQPLE